MKLAAAVLISLAGTAQADDGAGDDDVISINGEFALKCHNTEVVDVGAGGFHQWMLFTYCPVDENDSVGTLQSVDLDACIANDHGALTWREGGRFSASCSGCTTETNGSDVFLSCSCAKDGVQKETPARTFNLADFIAWQSKLVCNTDWATY